MLKNKTIKFYKKIYLQKKKKQRKKNQLKKHKKTLQNKIIF